MKIALCGSTRFKDKFNDMQLKVAMGGHVVYSLNAFGREATDVGKDESYPLFSEEDKVRLDLIHLAKIEESDAILVINIDKYIGDSTRREIMWARLRGKKVFFVDDPYGTGMPEDTERLLHGWDIHMEIYNG